MLHSIYTAIKSYQETKGDTVERLKGHGLFEVFKPIIETYGDDMETFNAVLFYVINAYSKESQFHFLHQEWKIIKHESAKDAGVELGSELYYKLINLECSALVTTIRQYLDRQFSKPFKHLIMLKDLYDQLVNGAIENITDKDEKVNYDQKRKNADHASDIYEQIGIWEQKIEVDKEQITKVENELKAAEKKYSLRLEDNLTR